MKLRVLELMDHSADFYYLNTAQQPVGPMSLEGIRKLVHAGIVDSKVLVCPAGEQEWKPLSEWGETATTSAGPPRVPPPPRAHPPASEARAATPSPVASEWFPLASMIAGILAVLALFSPFPIFSILFAVPALSLGILALRQNVSGNKPFAMAGIGTSSVALLVSFGFFLLGLAGGFTGNPEAAAMERALAHGIEIGRDAAKRFPNDAARQSRFIASELQKVDTRGCPPEFRVAYQRNVEAWEIATPYFQADNPLTSFLEGLYGGLNNDYSVVGTSNYQARLAAQNIDETYQQLKMTAVALGAGIPAM